MVKTAEPPSYTSAPVDQLAATVKGAAQTGGSKIITGTVVADPVDGWVDVDRGGGEIIPARVAGSFRSTVKAGQEVQLAAQGTHHYVGAILTPLPAPTVAAPPAAASTVTGSGATASWTASFYYRSNCANISEVNTELDKIETALNNLIDGLQDLVAAHNTTASAVSGVVTGVNSAVAKVNSINQTTAGLRSALLDQGHIS